MIVDAQIWKKKPFSSAPSTFTFAGHDLATPKRLRSTPGPDRGRACGQHKYDTGIFVVPWAWLDDECDRGAGAWLRRVAGALCGPPMAFPL